MTAEEPVPVSTVQHKSHVTKVMALLAIACLRWTRPMVKKKMCCEMERLVPGHLLALNKRYAPKKETKRDPRVKKCDSG